MGAGGGTDLLYRITGDPAPLKEALNQAKAEVSAANAQISSETNATQDIMRRTVAESAKEQGATITQVKQIYEQLGISGAKAAEEIKGAFAGLAPEIEKGGEAGQKAAEDIEGAGGKTDKALLSNVQSTRLLASELGIHLPRAAMGAVAKILPDLGSLSTALLTVFAAKEIIAFVGWLVKVSDEMNEVARSARLIGEAAKESDKNLLSYAATSAEASYKQIQIQNGMTEALNKEIEARRTLHEQLPAISAYLAEKIVGWIDNTKTLTSIEEKYDHAVGLGNELLQVRSKYFIDAAKEEFDSQVKLLDLHTRADAAGKTRAEAIKIEIAALEQKRQLEVRMAEEEVAHAELQSGRTSEAKAAPKIAIINQEIELQKKLLENELAGLHTRTDASREYAAEIERSNALLRERLELEGAGEGGAREQAITQAQREIDAENKIVQAAQHAFEQKKITKAEMQATEKAYADAVVLINQELQSKMEAIDTKETEREDKVREKIRSGLAKEAEARAKLAQSAVENAEKIAKAADTELRAEVAKAAEANASTIGLILIRSDAHIKELEMKASERAATIQWAESVANADAQVITSERQLTEARLAAVKSDPSGDPSKITELTALVQQMKQKEAAAYAVAAQAAQAYGKATWDAQQLVTQAMTQEEGETDKAVKKMIESFREKSREEIRAYESIKTPGAMALVQLHRELDAIKERSQAVKEHVAAMRASAVELEKSAKAERDDAANTKDSSEASKKNTDAKDKETHATKLKTEAMLEEVKAEMLSVAADAEAVSAAAANLLTTLGQKKAAAYVDMVMQTADAIASLAVQDYEGAALHFLSAAEYGIVAGQASKTAAGANVGRGSGGQAPGASGPQSAGAMGSETPMQPEFTAMGGQFGGNINVHVYGPADEANHIAGVLNNFTQRQGGQLVASRSILPTKAGR